MARPRQVSDSQILDAAKICFLEHGPSVSTTVIAARLGVSQAALFKRFGTKEELLLASLRPDRDVSWIERLEDGPDERDIREQLMEIAVAGGRFFDSIVPCMSILRANGMNLEDMHRQAGEPPPLRGQRLLASWLRAAQSQGRARAFDADAVSIAFLGALQARPFMQHVSGHKVIGASAREYAASVVDTLWEGIAMRGVA